MFTKLKFAGILTLLLLLNVAACADNASTNISNTLATYYPADRSDAFFLVADYDYSHNNVTIDEEETRISNLCLYVKRISVKKANNWKPLELQFPKQWDFRGIAATPLWPKGRVTTDYILPTGEFFNSGSSGLCCVIFDGTFRLYQLDAAKGVFVVTTPTDELTMELRKWYAISFKVDDVYWSYGLVTHPEFFGRKNIDLKEITKSPPLLRIEELYSAWQQIAAQQVK